jgi:hypothetical protein
VNAIAQLRLPTADGGLRTWEPAVAPPRLPPPPAPPPRSRAAYAAAHVVADPLASNAPGSPAALDWEATLEFRRWLWGYGLGVAEAMDTAQRGMGLDWPTTRELIERTGAEARAVKGSLVCGAGTDQLATGRHALDDVGSAYEEQCEVVESAGARIVLMASRALAASADEADDYDVIYERILTQVRDPVILHWLGPEFDPQLDGYWGSTDLDKASESFIDIVTAHAPRIDGIKLSLLDKAREIELRRRLPSGVRLYTGDDFNYPELIGGTEENWSDALLGIFDPIAPAASAALLALDAGNRAEYDRIFEPTVPLARTIFEAPTFYYKTGIVFLAWLAGHQTHFRMVGGLESVRSLPHLSRVFVLADSAGLLPDRELAESRMRLVLRLAGIET